MKIIETFLKNPIEAIANLFGYTIQPNKSLLFMSMLDFTHETHFQQIQRQGRMEEYFVKH
jgi:hypothetical protein